MAMPPPPSRISAADRLSLTLFIAAALYASLILGLSFAPHDRRPAETPLTLEVTMVKTRAEKAPDKADFLAETNQEGGGQVEDKVVPTTPTPSPDNTPQVETAPPPTQPSPPKPATRAVLAQKQPAAVKAPPKMDTTEPEPSPPSAAEIISRGLEIASLSAQLDRSVQAYAQRPRHKFINARTKEYKYAAYLRNWVAKVERIGNLNYPDEARRAKLSGNLLLDVTLKPDGSVQEVTLRRSSGHKVLDDAAIRIVRLAAPFAPFPDEIRQETDILHITRTWQFMSDGGLFSR